MNAKRPIYSALVILALAGCASGNSFRAGNRMKLLKLSPGMSKTEVLDAMGVGEQRVCCPLRTVTNPHRTEAYSAGGSRFEVLYYYTDKKTDSSNDPYSSNASNVQDDELLPIVLKDGKLEGWGWSFWNDTVNRYEIRIRQ
ncbi:MAG TPA: hypothetical protein DHU55_18735 [Blastocatellia bacterium]|nr:hypothetical protein [Blastocatellia bacterium]